LRQQTDKLGFVDSHSGGGDAGAHGVDEFRIDIRRDPRGGVGGRPRLRELG